MIVPFDFDGLCIRTIVRDGQPWFVVADLAKALDYRDASDATRLLDSDEKGTHILRTLGGTQKLSTCNESGMYHIVLASRKTEAKRFRKWVTGDVLPSIRKTGQYQEDWRKSRHAVASTSKVVAGILEAVRATIGKTTDSVHYMTEHKLINYLLTGEFKGLDRKKLTVYDLDFLAHFEMQDAVFIGMGMTYDERKQRLMREAVIWKSKQLSVNDDRALAAA